MSRLSLKYRIAVVIFLLESVLMALTLGTTLSRFYESNRAQLEVTERVLLNLLSDLSRIALFTAEYDELQPYIEQIVADPHVVRVLLVGRHDRIVVSSHVGDVGGVLPPLVDTKERFWRTQEIGNPSGRLGMLAINFSYSELNKANLEALDRGISVALSGMLFIAVVGVIIGYLLTRRLGVLTAAAQRFAHGDLNVKTGFSGSDEIAILGQTFDLMARNIERDIADLNATEQELRSARNELEHRVLERTAELAVARDQALEASRTKSTFLANMSHELRTPLNAIIGYSEMLVEDADASGYPGIASDLNKIKAAGTHLLALINDVLDLSKIEAGKVELHIEPFTIGSLVQEAVGAVQPILSKNANILEVHCEAHLGSMRADKVKLRQALINLLSNAGKFTEGGRVLLGVNRVRRCGYEEIEFTVQDTGIGIPFDQLDRLFADFYQVDPSSTRKHGGTGLGLAISRRYCQMMGGTITVESEPNRGSTFKITLPALVNEAVDPKVDEDLAFFDPELVRRGPQHGVRDAVDERRQHIPSVLVIDDNAEARDLLQRYLSRQGFHVELACSGAQGIELARLVRPDVITLDVMMPEISGWEVLRLLKDTPDLAPIPVIMITMVDEQALGYSLGAAHFVSKPLEGGVIMEVLTQLLRKASTNVR